MKLNSRNNAILNRFCLWSALLYHIEAERCRNKPFPNQLISTCLPPCIDRCSIDSRFSTILPPSKPALDRIDDKDRHTASRKHFVDIRAVYSHSVRVSGCSGSISEFALPRRASR